LTAEWIGGKFSSLSIVSLEADSDGRLMAVKTSPDNVIIERIQHDLAFLKNLTHPLIVRHFPNTMNHSSAITTEFATKASLANHLADSQNTNLSVLRGPTAIARISPGIALAMCYVHSQSVIHCNLTPDNILLDSNWNVPIADFRHSISAHELPLSPPTDTVRLPPGDAHYVAAECYDNKYGLENDIFSFGLILYEIIFGNPVFPRSMTPNEVAWVVVITSWDVEIPNCILPETAELIRACLAVSYLEWLCFSGTIDRLEQMRFKLIQRVNSSKLPPFIKEMTLWETSHHR
jgi:serine/threonine protein kinase